MNDIFISYAHEDKDKAQQYANAFEDSGFSVWWDRHIPVGRVYEDVIDEAIEDSKCVVVLWSEYSTKARWVKSEANEGLKREILIPVQISDTKISLSFRHLNTANMVLWDGSVTNNMFDRLVNDIKPLVEPIMKIKPKIKDHLDEKTKKLNLKKKFEQKHKTESTIKPLTETIAKSAEIQGKKPLEYNTLIEKKSTTSNKSRHKKIKITNKNVFKKFLNSTQDLQIIFGSIILFLTFIYLFYTPINYLDLADTNFNDKNLLHLTSLQNLTNLNLWNTKITDKGLIHLKSLQNLTKLTLHSTEVSDKGLVYLKSLQNLTYLDLGSTKITDKGLIQLMSLQNLTYLDLGSNTITDKGLIHLKLLQNLTNLDLWGTKITDKGLVHLKSLQNLTNLNLLSTKITDKGLVHLKSLQNLTNLNLNFTKITDKGLVHLKSLQNLTSLNLYIKNISNDSIRLFKSSHPKLSIYSYNQ